MDIFLSKSNNPYILLDILRAFTPTLVLGKIKEKMLIPMNNQNRDEKLKYVNFYR